MSWAAPWDRDARPRSRADECDPLRRVGARIIDGLVLSPILIVSYALDWVDDHETAAAVLWSLVGAAYEVVLVALAGRTVGKLATHARVTAADGSPVGWLQSVVRYAALFGPVYVLGRVVGPIGIGWDLALVGMVILHGLGPHDYVARTKVVTDIKRPDGFEEPAPPPARTVRSPRYTPPKSASAKTARKRGSPR